MREGSNEDALRCFNEALKLNPENPKFQNNRVAALIELQKLPEALALINVLLEQYPDYVLAWINRLKLARLQKDCQGVVLLGRKIIKMEPLMAPTVQSLLDF